MKQPQPYGGWSSPIDSAVLVGGTLRLSAPRIFRDVLYWLEGRPAEGGRQVLMAVDLLGPERIGTPREISPEGSNVRTRVHEYGGGEFAVVPGGVFFVDDRDGRIYSAPLTGGRPAAAAAVSTAGSRFADLVCSPDARWLVAVEERPRSDGESDHRLVAFALAPDFGATPGAAAACTPRVVAAGRDFYASPCFAADGHQLAFIAWDHPNMPWNGTWLESVEWGREGCRSETTRRGGGRSESIFQPRYSAAGALFAVSDRSGWWNLVRYGEHGVEPVHSLAAELGRAQWLFGLSSWDFLSDRLVVASATYDGCDRLLRLDLETGRETVWNSSFCSLSGLDAQDGWLVAIAGSFETTSSLTLWPKRHGAPICVRSSSDLVLPETMIAPAEIRSFSLPDGRTTHSFVYLPRSESSCARPGERPPLLVKSHGGPTSATSAALDPRIQFWTSRGFAVADINYAGSTGYGRAYRDQLERAWGIVDVEDCVAVAEALGAEGLVDAKRLAISGGSAGGFTTLSALTFHSVFAAGASHYGIGDLEALARDTHKFESRYTDWLIGEWPQERERYVARSPIHHYEGLSCPVIFFQGLEDRVVPPSQAEAMVEVLARRGIPHAYVPFEGEQHGFRRAENLRTALDGELYFYSRVFGFDAPRPASVHVVAGQSGSGRSR